MNVTATFEHHQIVLRSRDHGEVFAVTIAPSDALNLARDLLDLAISRMVPPRVTTASSIWRRSGSLQIKNMAGTYSAAVVAQKKTAAPRRPAPTRRKE